MSSKRGAPSSNNKSSNGVGRREEYYYYDGDDHDDGSSSSDYDSVVEDEEESSYSSSSSYSTSVSNGDNNDDAEIGYPPSTTSYNNNNNAAAVRRRMAPSSGNNGHRSASEPESSSDVDVRNGNHHHPRHHRHRHRHHHHHHHHRQNNSSKYRQSSSSSSQDVGGNERYNKKSKKGSSNSNNNKCFGCKVIPHLRNKVCRRLFRRFDKKGSNKKNVPPPPSIGAIICRQIPTILLIGCFVFWLLVQTSDNNVYPLSSSHNNNNRVGAGGGGGRGNNYYRHRQNSIQQEQQQQQQQQHTSDGSLTTITTTKSTTITTNKGRKRRGPMSFLSDAMEGLMDIVNLPAKVLTKSTRGEALMPGCVRSPWQVHNYQNCNDMHETDLYEVFSGRVQKDGGYVGSGYWRHVWLVDPRQEWYYHHHHHHQSGGGEGPGKGGAVLKMMKNEHKVETRNFERHRRDALAMERLTSSNHIVDIYSYCGNSVLTEYVGSDMHQVLYHSEETTTTTTTDGSEKQQQARRRENNISSSSSSSSRTDREMLQLALQVVQGVADLHQVPGGPIVHADIADKQFLVDPDGNVKLNDFNRCRFMGHKKTTKEKCSFRIPSSPGRHRSPEEYNDEELTEQLDTFSTANVLYGILTGSPPWGDEPSSQVKRAVKRGHKPPIDEEYRIPGTPSALLASLIDQAYEHDPEERITAPALAEELKKALKELRD